MKNLVIIFSLLLSFKLLAQKKGVDVTVSLSPVGSFHIKTNKIKGKLKKKGAGYTGKEVYVKIKHLKTGMDLRDEHMRQRLSPKKYPKIKVTNIMAKNGKGKAYISIKGIKKPIKFSYSVAGKMMEAKFKLNLAKFKIKNLTYLSVGAKKIVEVNAIIPIK